MSLLSILKIMHLSGLVMGLGGAVLADFLILFQAVLRPVRQQTIELAHGLARIVFAGLGLLWISGAALVYIRFSADPHFIMNEKLWAKVIIVSILTINGIAVHRIALNHLARRSGAKLFDTGRPIEMAGLTLVAALSSVSWFVPFVLGVATELNFKVKVLEVLGVYAATVLATWCMVFAAARLASTRPVVDQAALDLELPHAVLRHRLEKLVASFATEVRHVDLGHGIGGEQSQYAALDHGLKPLAGLQNRPGTLRPAHVQNGVRQAA